MSRPSTHTRCSPSDFPLNVRHPWPQQVPYVLATLAMKDSTAKTLVQAFDPGDQDGLDLQMRCTTFVIPS